MANLVLVSERILPCLCIPGEGQDSTLDLANGGEFRSRPSGHRYPAQNGIPSLCVVPGGEWDHVTTRIKAFYEDITFPNYDGLEDFGDIVRKGLDNSFSRALLNAVGANKRVLEVGCGTGQLSHFLQLNNNEVLGVDLSLASLSLAIKHKIDNELRRSSFIQMDLFNLAIRDSSFDVVISNGVLHHTPDAKRAFAEIVRKVKPGGLVVVGLYNRYARIPYGLRGLAYRIGSSRRQDAVTRRSHDARKAQTWIRDQYFNPHESWHTLDEVLGWFQTYDVEFVNSVPAILGTEGESSDDPFLPSGAGNRYLRLVSQIGWIGSVGREGGIFIVVGRKKIA